MHSRLSKRILIHALILLQLLLWPLHALSHGFDDQADPNDSEIACEVCHQLQEHDVPVHTPALSFGSNSAHDISAFTHVDIALAAPRYYQTRAPPLA